MQPLDWIRQRFAPKTPHIDAAQSLNPDQILKIAYQAMRQIPGAQAPLEEWQIYGYSGWEQGEVQAALDSLDVGNLRWAESLLLAMCKDPIFFHGLKTRTQRLVATPMQLIRPDGCPEEPFNELQDHLPALWGQDTAGAHGLAATAKYRVALGVAPGSVTWPLSPSGLTFLPQVTPQSAGWLTYYPVEQRYRFMARDVQHPVIPDGKEWVLFREMSALYPHTEGLIRPTAAIWWLKSAMIRLWWAYARAHGSGQRKIKVPGKQRQDNDVKDLIQVARDLMGGAVVVCPQYADGTSFDFELVEAKYSTYETFPHFIDYVDKWITLCWLGAIDNTQGSDVGSRARAQVHDGVTLRYLSADCTVTEAALRILLRQWCRYNRIDPRFAPTAVFDWKPEPDRKAEAETRKVNAEALDKVTQAAERIEAHGVGVEWAELAELHGVPLSGLPPKKMLALGAPGAESKTEELESGTEEPPAET